MKASPCEKLQRLSALFWAFSALKRFVPAGVLDFDAIVALLWLRGQDGCTPGRLAADLCFDPAKATRTLKKLTSLGLIAEVLDGKDLRKCHFRLTSRGENVSFEMLQAFGKASIEYQIDCFVQLRRAARASQSIDAARKMAGASQRVLLFLLLAGDAEATAREVCDSACLPQSTVSVCLKALREEGLVQEDESPNDRRVRNIRLTARGKQMARSMLPELRFLEKDGPYCLADSLRHP